MDRWKSEMGRVREKRRVEERRSEKRKSQKKEDADVRKRRKVAKHSVFPMTCGSGGSKSRLAKAAGGAIWPDERWQIARRCGAKHIWKSKCTKHTRSGPLLEVAMSKKCTPLWREAHVQVKKAKNISRSDHIWKLRCRKSARRCGAKHISKSTCWKHRGFVFDVVNFEK